MTMVAGLDVGGANLKVARVDGGRLIAACEIACELWNGLAELDRALDAAAELISGAQSIALTMTGELCELFPSRRDGVITLATHLERRFGETATFYRGLRGFGTASAARDDWSSVASANFLATAEVIAKRRPESLLIDFGSTTTDIIACDRPQGLTDAERLVTGELVYTGLTRTPVPSVTTRGILAGQWQGLARDAFATMADVRRVLGELPPDIEIGTSLEESLVRLARGFGRDADIRQLDVWKVAARHITEAQVQSIIDGALQVLSRPRTKVTGVVTAGIGAPVATAIADRLGLPSTPFGDVIEADPACRIDATRYAPAAAVALLLSEKLSA